jgi:hypothetical protein
LLGFISGKVERFGSGHALQDSCLTGGRMLL